MEEGGEEAEGVDGEEPRPVFIPIFYSVLLCPGLSRT